MLVLNKLSVNWVWGPVGNQGICQNLVILPVFNSALSKLISDQHIFPIVKSVRLTLKETKCNTGNIHTYKTTKVRRSYNAVQNSL